MNTRNLLTTLFLLACVAQEAAALVRMGAGNVEVHARGPAGLRITGKSTEVSLVEDSSVLLFKAAIAPLDTGIGLRNRHLREALEADRFPEATLSVKRADLRFPGDGTSVEGETQGELTLHGQSHPVAVRYRAERKDDLTHIAGSLRLDLRDFAVVTPSYLGVAVSPEVEVDLDLAVEGL